MRASLGSMYSPAPMRSAPETIVRSFHSSNGTPSRPIRWWR